MSTEPVNRGMAWDHPRACDPLNAISARWSEARNVKVHWDARPLKDFEDQPLKELATQYDLVLIDHPFVGAAAASGLIRPVNDWVDGDYLADQAANSAGPSYSSYTWDGQQWALAIDAACQVSAVREDLLNTSSAANIPTDWSSVLKLAYSLRDDIARVALPLNPNHAYCAFLSIAQANAGFPVLHPGNPIDVDTGIEALEFLFQLTRWIHPLSRQADPIVISDFMSDADEIAFVPLMFGYSSYARPGFRPRTLTFGNAPRGIRGSIGSVLGGVGLAVSACSAVSEFAADLARTIAAPQTQCGLYFESGGQPGHSAAWHSTELNEQIGNFFRETQATMDASLIRPRVPGHREFQVEAGELIYQFLWGGEMKPSKCMAVLNNLVEKRLDPGDELNA